VRITAAIAALLLLFAIAAGHASASPKVAVIVLENHEFDDVIGNDDVPYLNALARRNVLATRYYGVAHPSLPNYIALLGGSTLGIDENCTSCARRGDNLAAQLSRAGIGWRAYFEQMPKACFAGDEDGEYVKRHNPFMYFRSVFEVFRQCHHVVPLARLHADLRKGSLPAFSWIGPGLCSGGHDCGLDTVDRWLERLVPRIVRGLGRRGIVVITFDEGTSDRGCCGRPGGGRVATIVAGPAARRGVRLRRPLDHYSLLATIETVFGLTRLRHARGAPTLLPALAR